MSIAEPLDVFDRPVPVRSASGSPLELPGTLALPADCIGLVLFAHGSGSSRLSPRNRFVARRLNEIRLATHLFDLLTPQEAANRVNVFDIALLADRLLAAVAVAAADPITASLPLGLFGASTGAAAAVIAAAREPRVKAIVSRGGRVDLASEWLARLHVPTLLIVGGRDAEVLALNRESYARITAERRLAVIAGASHLFEEPGCLGEAALLAAEWFARHLHAEAP
jgi:putative phosphoribosyl transferase